MVINLQEINQKRKSLQVSIYGNRRQNFIVQATRKSRNIRSVKNVVSVVSEFLLRKDSELVTLPF